VIDPDELPDGLLVADADGVVVLVNRAAGRLLGVDPAGLTGRPLGDALPLRDDLGRDWWSCQRAYAGLPTRTGFPERSLRLAGSDRRLLVTGRVVREPGGRVGRVIVGLRGAPVRQPADRDGAELVAVLAHDLRSPLTSVKGFASTLISRWDRLDEEQKLSMLGAVRTDADRLARLITTVVDAARLQAGRLELRREPVDLPRLCAEACAEQVAAGQPAGRFRVVGAAALPELWGDAGRLGQVVRTLVDNAVRHGGGTVTVTTSRSADPAGVALTVTDEGTGVPDGVAPGLFDRFWRADRRGAGGGLGLYVAGGVVAAHGGRITVDRAAGGGARFTVALPTGAAAS
jgi:PAS domain S-box-containing protein